MKPIKRDIFHIILTPILDIIGVFSAFWIAYNLRSVTDGIPFIRLRAQYISEEHFAPFVFFGIIIWLIVFARAELYAHTRRPLFEEIRRVAVYAFFWFLAFIGFVYLTQGFIFFKEIPRLIIVYTLVLSTIFSIFSRIILELIGKKLYEKNFFKKERILVIRAEKNEEIIFNLHKTKSEYIFAEITEPNRIENLIRDGKIDAILLTSMEFQNPSILGVINLAKIYGIKCSYPQVTPETRHFSRQESFVAGIPVMILSSVAITPWGMVLKRIVDIFLSIFFIILTLPLMIIAYIGIKIEDPSGPVIYKNRRIGQNGKIFSLFKFRYMYWKFCTKEDYIKEGEKDEWLEYEEKLKKSEDNVRVGPLYKIKNDPRKMKFGSFLERFSIDELPQLFNVLFGNMSIVGPRPHQPREVALYDESDKQVLTIKPGITGMAQVYGRDKNTFKEEVLLDTYYIENYSLSLDIMIILRTIIVVLKRPFEKNKN